MFDCCRCCICTAKSLKPLLVTPSVALRSSLFPVFRSPKMMKLSQTLKSRNLFGKYCDIGGALGLHAFTSQSGISTDAQNSAVRDRVFAPFSVFKGKAALSVEPVLPTFSQMDSGNFRIERRGTLMFTFMPAIGERKYNNEKRQKFALSAIEVGSLISLGPKDGSEFFHDPSMLSSNAGQVRKSLSIKPHADGSGYFISLSVVNNILKTNERFTVPITTAEFAVLRTACSFALPHILGWDQLTTTQSPKGTSVNPPKVNPKVAELEWDR